MDFIESWNYQGFHDPCFLGTEYVSGREEPVWPSRPFTVAMSGLRYPRVAVRSQYGRWTALEAKRKKKERDRDSDFAPAGRGAEECVARRALGQTGKKRAAP
ncbi:hypothetical protein NDU88_003633 [Pleurodeles waltl]|uniref:Uncharacterized protein n=1 Tax=Pleurodeles waltl TaxID=8319 RepID=A0AAV7PA52_PLEWA|nr:hypothetical protein NDU88_003633 [Pleurodeles waltl]